MVRWIRIIKVSRKGIKKMKKNWNPKEIRARIDEILPPGKVIPRHNEKGHFYEVTEGEFPIYPSVTSKLQILKDQGLMNYKMNRAVEYVFGHYKEFNDSNIMEHLDTASRVSQDILEDAGDIGIRIHSYREKIFKEWIDVGIRPENFLSFIPPEDVDVRAISAIRALQQFCIDKDYIPIYSELLVYSHEDKVAGTLDDLGLMRKIINEGDKNCDHSVHVRNNDDGNWGKYAKTTCLQCGYQSRYEFILMDVKTSNQLKDHYFFQVCLYWI